MSQKGDDKFVVTPQNLHLDPSKIMDKVMAEAKSRGKKLRCTSTKPMKVAAYDLIGLLRDCDYKKSNKIWMTLAQNETSQEMRRWFDAVEVTKIDGKGEHHVPYLDAKQVIEFIGMLRGNEPLLTELKAFCSTIVVHAAAGDKKLARAIDSIDEKFMTGQVDASNPLNLFRDSISPPAMSSVDYDIEEATRMTAAIDISAEEKNAQSRMLFDAKIKQINQQMKIDADKSHAEIAKIQVETARNYAELMAFVRKNLNEQRVADDRERIARDAQLSNITRMESDYLTRLDASLRASPQLAIEAADAPPHQPTPEVKHELTFDQFSNDIISKTWINDHCSAIGKAAAALYRAEHGGAQPPKHEMVLKNGRTAQVNTYYTGDENIIRRAIQDVWNRTQ